MIFSGLLSCKVWLTWGCSVSAIDAEGTVSPCPHPAITADSEGGSCDCKSRDLGTVSCSESVNNSHLLLTPPDETGVAEEGVVQSVVLDFLGYSAQGHLVSIYVTEPWVVPGPVGRPLAVCPLFLVVALLASRRIRDVILDKISEINDKAKIENQTQTLDSVTQRLSRTETSLRTLHQRFRCENMMSPNSEECCWMMKTRLKSSTDIVLCGTKIFTSVWRWVNSQRNVVRHHRNDEGATCRSTASFVPHGLVDTHGHLTPKGTFVPISIVKHNTVACCGWETWLLILRRQRCESTLNFTTNRNFWCQN